MNDFDRIEAVCQKLGFHSLKAFAQALGINAQIFYDIKSGKTQISKNVATAIQEKFQDISVAWLITGEGDMFREDIAINGDNIHQNGGQNNIGKISGDSEVVSRLLSLLEKKDEQIGEVLSQNRDMVEIIKQLTKK